MAEPRQNGSPARARLRCAVYTRKSSEEGLEQEFNSLDAQREACEAYITSQKHDGWTALSTLYDDGAYSGGTMDRPALQRMLDDIRAGRIDVVVVYKVDRLTRSLADFAKIVEVFDAQGVSFVTVTQAFNTATSLGRLTLNVLLSFAQFEREVMNVNKVHHVTTLSRVAKDLGKNEGWIFDVANEMDVEDGVIWVYGVGDEGVMAFADFGIENLIDLIKIQRDDPTLLKRLNAAK